MLTEATGCVTGLGSGPSESKLSPVAFCCSRTGFSCSGATVCFCFCCCFWLCNTSCPNMSRGLGTFASSACLLFATDEKLLRSPDVGDAMIRLLVPMLTGPALWAIGIPPKPIGWGVVILGSCTDAMYPGGGIPGADNWPKGRTTPTMEEALGGNIPKFCAGAPQAPAAPGCWAPCSIKTQYTTIRWSIAWTKKHESYLLCATLMKRPWTQVSTMMMMTLKKEPKQKWCPIQKNYTCRRSTAAGSR